MACNNSRWKAANQSKDWRRRRRRRRRRTTTTTTTTARDMIKNICWSSCKVPLLFLSDFNKDCSSCKVPLLFLSDFNKDWSSCKVPLLFLSDFNKDWSSCKVPLLFLSDFNKDWFFSTDLWKYRNINFHENPSSASRVFAMRAVCNFAHAPKDSTLCPHQRVFINVFDSWTNAVISLYSFTLSVFITKMECVYCAVRTGSLTTFRVILVLNP